MAITDRTIQFRELVAKSAIPDVKRRRVTISAKREGAGITEAQSLVNKEFQREAYSILKHLNNLNRTLSSIRRAYLSVDEGSSSFSRYSSRSLEFEGDGSEQLWSGVRHLSDEERDQIDMQAKIILSKCADRVRQMEMAIKERSEESARDSNLLLRMLPTRLKQSSSSATAATFAAHHSGITYYLSRRLAETSKNQKEMQEERIKRQTERTRTLGSAAGFEVADLMHMTKAQPSSLDGGQNINKSWLGDAAQNLAATILLPSPSSSFFDGPTRPDSLKAVTQQQVILDDFDEEYDDMELSASQIQEFEKENSNILQSVEKTLASIEEAQSRLMEISALQMELVTHLEQQSVVTEQLYEDAIFATETMEKGNAQLIEAKRRGKDSRLFILVFLLGASFSLLFLHYY